MFDYIYGFNVSVLKIGEVSCFSVVIDLILYDENCESSNRVFVTFESRRVGSLVVVVT